MLLKTEQLSEINEAKGVFVLFIAIPPRQIIQRVNKGIAAQFTPVTFCSHRNVHAYPHPSAGCIPMCCMAYNDIFGVSLALDASAGLPALFSPVDAWTASRTGPIIQQDRFFSEDQSFRKKHNSRKQLKKKMIYHSICLLCFFSVLISHSEKQFPTPVNKCLFLCKRKMEIRQQKLGGNRDDCCVTGPQAELFFACSFSLFSTLKVLSLKISFRSRVEEFSLLI